MNFGLKKGSNKTVIGAFLGSLTLCLPMSLQSMDSVEVQVMSLKALHEEAKFMGFQAFWTKAMIQVFGVCDIIVRFCVWLGHCYLEKFQMPWYSREQMRVSLESYYGLSRCAMSWASFALVGYIVCVVSTCAKGQRSESPSYFCSL